jgi:voltage-gated potassium channel
MSQWPVVSTPADAAAIKGGAADETTAPAAAAPEPDEEAAPGATTYALFIGVMTIFSLVVMVLLLFVDTGPVHDILYGADTLFCLIFLADFAISFAGAPSKMGYLWPHGLLDFLGSIPAAGPLRALRVFRLQRVYKLMAASGPRAIAKDFLARRAEAALYLIIILAMLVLTIGSSLVVLAEQTNPDANIKTGGDAFWWAFVTITTVGYGDRFPVTSVGRLVAMVTMAVGIGIFGVLTSYLSTIMLSPKKSDKGDEPAPAPEPVPTTDASALAGELAALRREIADLRGTLTASAPTTARPTDEPGSDTVVAPATPG